jgi:hypothetical protein
VQCRKGHVRQSIRREVDTTNSPTGRLRERQWNLRWILMIKLDKPGCIDSNKWFPEESYPDYGCFWHVSDVWVIGRSVLSTIPRNGTGPQDKNKRKGSSCTAYSMISLHNVPVNLCIQRIIRPYFNHGSRRSRGVPTHLVAFCANVQGVQQLGRECSILERGK